MPDTLLAAPPRLSPATTPFVGGEGFYRTLLDNLHDGVYFVDCERRITYWNRGAERITGYSADEVVGSRCSDNLLVHVNEEGCQLCLTECPLSKTIQDRSPRAVEAFLKHKNGSRVPVAVRAAPIEDARGRIAGAVETFSDNSSGLATVQMAKQLRNLAYIDPLTETGNRRYIDARLSEDLAKFHSIGWPMSVLFLDIDSFKQINDRHGHDVGDRVLQMTAGTITANLRMYDFVGRWGGDEFLVVLNHVGAEETLIIARRLRALIAASRIPCQNRMVGVTVSMGVTTARAEDSPASLVARADELLYCSKRQGRDRVTCNFSE